MDAALVRLESPNSPIRRIDSRNRLYQDKEKKILKKWIPELNQVPVCLNMGLTA